MATEEFKNELIRRIPDMMRFALAMTRSTQESEDLMHDTVLAAMEMADSYTPGTNMAGWLFTIQRGIFNNSLRRAKARQGYRQANSDMEEPVQPPSQIDHLVFEEAREAIDSLPVEQKAAFFLVSYDGKTYAEAARVLGCSVGTVKSRVSRARASIAKSIGLADDSETEPSRTPSASQVA